MLRLLFLLTVFGSLVTQIPGFIERGWDAPLKFLWLVTFACMMLFDTQSALDRRVRFLYLYLLPFLFYCALMTASTASLWASPGRMRWCSAPRTTGCTPTMTCRCLRMVR